MPEPPLFSVIIPVYNESNLICKSLEKITAYLKGVNILYEIIVVDDSSSDNTASLIRDFSRNDKNIILLRNETNRGKGYSVKKGILQAEGKYLLFTDADLSVPIEELSKFIPYLKDGYDIVVGSRRIKGSDVVIPQPLYRRLMGSIFYKIVYLFLFNSVRDTNCAFKCYPNDVAKEIFGKQTLSGWGFDAELLYIALKFNYKVKEVPVSWYNYGSSKVILHKAVFTTLAELLRIKINDWKGKYNK